MVNTSAQLSRLESGARPSTSPTEVNEVDGDADSGAGAVLDEVGDNKARDVKDRERWARLKKLRQVFHVKRGKGSKGGEKKSKGKENVVEVVD